MADEDSGTGGGASAPESPRSGNNNNSKNKMKFLCSHSGRILPRAGDGQLRYVGGETRAVVVGRDINFSDLKKKLASISEGDTVLKYQLIPGDLEALVSVKSDEDLRHMVEEYDRHAGTTGTSKLRAFLFPSTPIVVENNTSPLDPQTRYIDAINGIVRPAGLRPLRNSRSLSPLFASACTSPRSPRSCIVDYKIANQETVPQNGRHLNGQRILHRVHSSPNLSSLNQPSLSQPLQHNHHHYNYHYHHRQRIHRLGRMSPTGARADGLYSVRSIGRSETLNYQAISSLNNYYPVPVGKRGNMQ